MFYRMFYRIVRDNGLFIHIHVIKFKVELNNRVIKS